MGCPGGGPSGESSGLLNSSCNGQEMGEKRGYLGNMNTISDSYSDYLYICVFSILQRKKTIPPPPPSNDSMFATSSQVKTII